MGRWTDALRELQAMMPGAKDTPLEPVEVERAYDPQDSLLAVKIGDSLIGDYWLCLSDTEPFDPGDGLPVYCPAEIRALSGKGYDAATLRNLHDARMILDGRFLK
jgi:hypothetical protein